MDVNIELYRVFYWIAKEKNITKTAEKLFVSQSAVTQSLKKLEEQLGGTLFIRSKKGVELTEAGEKLYNYIESSINTLNNAENMFSQYTDSESGTIRICGGSAICSIFFPELVSKVSEKYPRIRLTLKDSKTKEAKEKLLKDEIDMLIIEEINEKDTDEIEIIPIMDFEFCFFTTPEYLEKVGGFKKENANEYLYVVPQEGSRRRISMDKLLKDANVEINPQYEFTNGNVVKEVVGQGVGIGYINELMIADELKKGKYVKVDFGLKKIKDRIVVVIKDSRKTSNAVLKITEMIKEIFDK